MTDSAGEFVAEEAAALEHLESIAEGAELPERHRNRRREVALAEHAQPHSELGVEL